MNDAGSTASAPQDISCTALPPAIHRRPRYPPPGHSSLAGGYASDRARVQANLGHFFERDKNVIRHCLKLGCQRLASMIKNTRRDRELVPRH